MTAITTSTWWWTAHERTRSGAYPHSQAPRCWSTTSSSSPIDYCLPATVPSPYNTTAADDYLLETRHRLLVAPCNWLASTSA